MSATTDLWYHYGRTRADHDRVVPDAFRWTWGQDTGPGPELLGEVTGRVLGDLGSGAARHAAHLAVRHAPARVDAIDSSPAQHGLAVGMYAPLGPRLRLVQADVIAHLRAHPGAYDVLYSVFGAACFTDPCALLPAARGALRPGGRLVFSTLAHHLTGTPARTEVRPSDICARTPDSDPATMRRWVLQEQVWVKALDEAGFAAVEAEVLPSRADGAPRGADTLIVTGVTEKPSSAARARARMTR